MPFGDRTGPIGLGPMKGRAAGYCAGYAVPGYMNPVQARGLNFRIGRGGRGRRNWFYATGLTGWQRAAYGYPSWGTGYANLPAPFATGKEQEMALLKNQAEYLENALKELNQRIQELGGEKREKA
jgi:hypothetical protein